MCSNKINYGLERLRTSIVPFARDSTVDPVALLITRSNNVYVTDSVTTRWRSTDILTPFSGHDDWPWTVRTN